VRFQAVEKVSVVDSERVLIVLEQQLRRRVGGDVEREGTSIVLYGLGPSPRAINPRDTTVIEVRVEGDITLIDADVNFQASALAAPVGQEEIVRNKLERVLRATRQQLEEEQDWLESERRERAEEATLSSGISSSSARIYTGPLRPFELADSSSMHKPEPPVVTETVAEPRIVLHEHKDEPVEPSYLTTHGHVDEVVESSPGPVAVAPPVVEVKDKALPEAKADDAASYEADNAAMGQQQHSQRATTTSQMPQSRHSVSSYAGMPSSKQDTEPNRPWMRWVAVAACVAAIVPFAWRMRPKAEPAQVIDLTQSAAPKPAAVTESGPEGALRQWELAQRSTDVNTQTAYYAVPVEQYMWRHNVNRHDLQAMKQQELARRRGLWTVKMEDVNIQRKDGEADVTLVKHIMEQPQNGGKVRERLVHTELTLKNSLGIWWITSEKEIYPKKLNASDDDNFDPNEGETPDWAKPSPTSVAGGTTPSAASTN